MNTNYQNRESNTRHYFVDEAGDLTLFGRRGKAVIGQPGISKTFMVGLATIADPEDLKRDMESLREEITSDAYFANIPSIQPERKKTARCFHAKDDCPEVRMLVYRLLKKHNIRVQVAIRRKRALLTEARMAKNFSKNESPNIVYDTLVKSLFERVLHKASQNEIYFARRGKSTRQRALEDAIETAQRNFLRDTGIEIRTLTTVHSAVPSDVHGLQAIDYYLWAIQRLYERNEWRYFEYVRENFSLIMDFDDDRTGRNYGTWYSGKNPLTEKTMLPVAD